MKNIIKTAGFGLLLTILAACGNGGDTAPAPAPEAAPADTGETVDLGNAPEGQEDVTLVLSTVTNEAGAWGGEQLVEVAYELSGGTLIIDHFPANQLGPDRQVIEDTIFGNIDIAMSATSALVDLFPDLALFDTHFLFRDHAHAHANLGGPVGRQLLDSMYTHGLLGMAFWEMGFRNLTNSVRAVHTPADLNGMVVRTLENPLHIAVWNSLGANPTPMSFAEVFTALQQGTVDGQENPLSIIDANSLYEVQDYIVLTQHAYVPHVVAMNMDRFNSLSPFHQEVILEAFATVTPMQWARSGDGEQAIYDRLSQRDDVSIISLTPEQHQQFADNVAEGDALNLVRETMNNPHLIDEVMGN